ncbi:MAG: hypothetical protein ACJ8C4_08455 [Gemmataceae bacterium]
MASSVQQAVLRRKVTYVAAMLVLLVVNTFFWRGAASRGGEPFPWTVTAQANQLELSELATGEADLTGSAVRLLLTGSRGLALATLWYQSDEKKKRHEWNKLELIVDSITRLQPHTAAPWLFQSWNIAYNVSVESDRVKDKFFYITRGMELLSKGIRLNKDHPDLRYMMGFYYQNKFGVSDEVNVLRSLMQMSSIDPRERDPGRLKPRDQIDPIAFEEFVKKQPQLVRRLREKLNKGREEVVDFLRENRTIPCRYYDPALDRDQGLKPAAIQFPVLPSEQPRSVSNLKWQESDLRDDFDNYQAAESWFAYALDPLPEPDLTFETFLLDRREQARRRGKRLPKAPAEVIFRHGPSRAASFIGERLEKEGWFDESGWEVDGIRVGNDRWFEQPLSVGTGVPWALDAWSKAAALWRSHGAATGLYLEPTEKVRLEEQAKLYRERYAAEGLGRDISNESVDAAMKESFRAYRRLYFYEQNRQMTNFAHHYYRANAELDPVTIQARKLLFEAGRLRAAAEPDRAMERYAQAFEQWKKVLTRYKEVREDTSLQEDVYELQVQYMDLINDYRGSMVRPVLVVSSMLEQGLAIADGMSIATAPLGTLQMQPASKPLPLPVVGPLDQLDPDGKAWMEPSIARGIRVKLGKEVEDAPPANAETKPPPHRTSPRGK